MNNYDWKTERKRGQNLFIVEGNHEKNKFLNLLFSAFPEIGIHKEDVMIYGTNIYQLYEDIIKFYDEEWNLEDIDLPYIVSKKIRNEQTLYKEDFVNIILVFDYERHDHNFSEEKIEKLQAYFGEMTDVGKLFLNYPMIESYQDLDAPIDPEYANRYVLAEMENGSDYKNSVNSKPIHKAMRLPTKIRELLSDRFEISGLEWLENFTNGLLQCKSIEELEIEIDTSLSSVLEMKKFLTAKNQLIKTIEAVKYLDLKVSYHVYIRELFNQIICQNIAKANKIQGGAYEDELEKVIECFQGMDLKKVLDEQNKSSQRIGGGIIWVLNTSVFIIPEYNLKLLET